MTQLPFPPLPLAEWHDSRDTIHRYSQLLGAVRRSLTPPQKHWWHVSLQAAACGLTTTPIPAGDMTFDMLLDLTGHQLSISTSEGDWWEVGLRGQSLSALFEEVTHALNSLGISLELERPAFVDDSPRVYDTTAIEDYWQALSQIDVLLKQFRGELQEECSPVQLWPHHFDLSLVWFSGRQVPNRADNKAERTDEQMAFGFATGDDNLPDPYFYISAYPWTDRLLVQSLPPGACWHTDGWKGAVLMYGSLLEEEQPREKLLNFWRQVQQAGAAIMASS